MTAGNSLYSAMYSLGMASRKLWWDGVIPQGVVDIVLLKPLSGAATIAREASRQKISVAELLERLPSDLADPPQGVPLADQGAFWLGYYHFPDAQKFSKQLTGEHLAKAGKLLYGERWQSELARAINVGDRRVREWVAGDRPIPGGAWADLAQLLRARTGEGLALLNEFRQLGAP